MYPEILPSFFLLNWFVCVYSVHLCLLLQRVVGSGPVRSSPVLSRSLILLQPPLLLPPPPLPPAASAARWEDRVPWLLQVGPWRMNGVRLAAAAAAASRWTDHISCPHGGEHGSWKSDHRGGRVQLQPHTGLHTLQHQSEPLPASSRPHVSAHTHTHTLSGDLWTKLDWKCCWLFAF